MISMVLLTLISQKKLMCMRNFFGPGKSNFFREGKECTICFTNKVDTVVLPCKHMCLCSDCAKDLRDRESQKCPMCRTSNGLFVDETNFYFLAIESYMGLKKF